MTGPLTAYEFISPEWNYVVAFAIGLGFGFILERSGFSSSRKLVGTFYGYDFVVLKVFFTAAVTAAFGIIYLNYLGLLDMSLLYLNPTFLQSAIIGGAIMGVGFLLGGFCPGTSMCAAAIGKIDAMVFIGGIFLGVLIFIFGYPLVDELYYAGDQGALLVYDYLGISRELFALALMLVAIGAFVFASWVEKRTKQVDY